MEVKRCVFKMNRVDELGTKIKKDDIIETISGIGGVERRLLIE
ncbi:hypothetical protein [Tissierella praeacuta]